MAKPKTPPKGPMQTWREEAEARKQAIMKLPLIAERWYVEERFPDYYQHDEYNGGSMKAGKTIKASDYFDSRQDAVDFVDTHVPDEEGGKFTIRHQYLRTHTRVWNEWGWF